MGKTGVLRINMGNELGDRIVGGYGDGECVERRKGADEDGCGGHVSITMVSQHK
jgi:hypothetical protein